MHRALDAGVRRFFLPNIDLESIPAMLELEHQFADHCHAMMGLHPCSVKADFETVLDQMEGHWAQRDFCAVGEIGMDLYWDTSFVHEQEQAFRRQIQWAVAKEKPFVIHCRDAFDEIFKVLATEALPKVPGIFHCFTGNLQQAQQAVEMGFKLGIGGVATFKNGGLDQVIPHIALEHLVLETDAPYLAPVPYRGKRNEAAYLLEIAKRVAELQSVSLEDLAYQTTANSKQIFGI